VIAAALTPVGPDFAPDLSRVVAHCGRLLRDGCDGINLLGTTGEAVSFSVAQRLAVMEAIAASGLPPARFMVGTGAAALADAVTLTAAATRLGFAGALVLPPFYYKDVGDDGLYAHFATLIERVAAPALKLYLYHFPALSGVPFSRGAIGRLVAAYPTTIAGLKDSSGDLAYAQAVVTEFPELAVFPSTEAILLDARRRGLHLRDGQRHGAAGRARVARERCRRRRVRSSRARRPARYDRASPADSGDPAHGGATFHRRRVRAHAAAAGAAVGTRGARARCRTRRTAGLPRTDAGRARVS
jgi:hypothetical protein